MFQMLTALLLRQRYLRNRAKMSALANEQERIERYLSVRGLSALLPSSAVPVGQSVVPIVEMTDIAEFLAPGKADSEVLIEPSPAQSSFSPPLPEKAVPADAAPAVVVPELVASGDPESDDSPVVVVSGEPLASEQDLPSVDADKEDPPFGDALIDEVHASQEVSQQPVAPSQPEVEHERRGRILAVVQPDPEDDQSYEFMVHAGSDVIPVPVDFEQSQSHKPGEMVALRGNRIVA